MEECNVGGISEDTINTKVKYSIIVAVYNVEKYITECIESICAIPNQFELILVDDGSTDKSGVICDQWAIKDNRIKVVHQKNQGLSGARNSGLYVAKGKWCMFIDGDDYITPNVLELFSKHIEDIDSPDIIIGGYYADNGKDCWEEKFFEKKQVFQNDEKEILIRKAAGIDKSGVTNIGVAWAKIYKTEFLHKYQLEFKLGLKRMQDMIFNIEAFYCADRIKYIDEPVYCYRLRGGSAVNKYSVDFEKTAMDIIESLYCLKNKYNISNIEDIIFCKVISLYMEIMRLTYTRTECKLGINEKIKQMKRIAAINCYNEAIYTKKRLPLTRKQTLIKKLLTYRLYVVVYIILKVRYTSNLKKISVE